MIVTERQQPVPTAKAVVAGGSGKTSHALRQSLLYHLTSAESPMDILWSS